LLVVITSITGGRHYWALTTRVWKSVLVHSPVRSRWGRLSGLDIYLVRSVVNGSVYDTQNTTSSMWKAARKKNER
jgi:hypothetical protein